jgi:hypothetical protein
VVAGRAKRWDDREPACAGGAGADGVGVTAGGVGDHHGVGATGAHGEGQGAAEVALMGPASLEDVIAAG